MRTCFAPVIKKTADTGVAKAKRILQAVQTKATVTVPKSAVKATVTVPKPAIKATVSLGVGTSNSGTLGIVSSDAGWKLKGKRNIEGLLTHWDGYKHADQAEKPDFGKVSKDCHKTAGMQNLIDVIAFGGEAKVIGWSKEFWRNWATMANAITDGERSSFGMFLGNNIFHLRGKND